MIKDEILKFFNNKNALVTGGTGLIGRQVVKLLADAGAAIKIVSLDKIKVDPAIDHVYGDLTDFNFCKEIIKGMDYIFHLAGIKASLDATIKMPASHFVPALMFNTNVLEACRLNNAHGVVYTSSIGAYANAEVFKENEGQDAPPMDFYAGWAKRMAEFQIQTYKIQYGLDNFSVVRPCNVYGPGDNFDPKSAMVIPTLMHRIYKGEDPVVVWGDGSAIRDFAYSRDVAEGIILAMYHGTGDQPFVNLGSGEGYTIRQLVETLNKFIDFTYRFDPAKPAGFPKRVMDISLSRKLIDFDPSTSLLNGLEETWQWFVENQDEYLMRNNYFRDE